MIKRLQDGWPLKCGTIPAKCRANLGIPVINKGSNYVFLTFDDGPHKKYTPKILDILKLFDVKACFFLVGRRAKKNPDIVMRIFEEGHDIGNHTYSHPVNPIFNYKNIIEEIKSSEEIIKEITGCKTYLFRSPGFSWKTNSKEMMNVAKRLGYFSINWSISSMDWLGIKKIIRHKILNKNINCGDILLFHDGVEKAPIAKRRATIDLLPDVLYSLKNRGLSPVRISNMFRPKDVR